MIHLVYKIKIRRQESQKSDSYWQEFEFDGSKNSSVANVAVWCENVGLAPC